MAVLAGSGCARAVAAAWFGLLTALVAASFSSLPAAADDYVDPRRKVALAVAVDGYHHTTALQNTTADVRLVAARLKAAGFTVTELHEPTLEALRDALGTFAIAAADADIALFYYAGHAVQLDGQNYMLPIEFDARNPAILQQLVAIDDVVKATAAARAQVVLLDACRDNPLRALIDRTLQRRATSAGLAAIELPAAPPALDNSGVRGLLVGYSTQPGTVALDGAASNGPYALALDDALRFIDEDMNSILVRASRRVLADTDGRQRPEHRVALTGPLHLVTRKAPLACDVLAAEEFNNVSVKGVAYDQIDVKRAEPACRADLERFPDNPRLRHNLARVLDQAGRKAEAVLHYRRAAEAGYDWAQNNLAVLLMNGEGIEPDPAEAVGWLRQAFNQGNPQATVNYTEHDLTPHFDELPRLVRVLKAALTREGYTVPARFDRLDSGTVGALDAYKLREGIRSKGISFQVLDRLGIVGDVFRGGN